MNILFTGASSFTGMHFVKSLVAQRHNLICIFTQSKDSYTGIRRARIQEILPKIRPIWNTRFGDATFLTVLNNHRIDTYTHHMAWTKGYNTTTYDKDRAIQNNTHQLSAVLQSLERNGCRQVLLTGSVFEGKDVDCRQGTAPFEAHGEAKKETTMRFLTAQTSIPIRRFIIPNPFGTFDQQRFVEYLHLSWLNNRTPHLLYPDNIRDNIPIPLLQNAYLRFVHNRDLVLAPSGFIESNASFAHRIAKVFAKHFGYSTPLHIDTNKDDNQPLWLSNTDTETSSWDEELFWRTLCHHYEQRFVLS